MKNAGALSLAAKKRDIRLKGLRRRRTNLVEMQRDRGKSQREDRARRLRDNVRGSGTGVLISLMDELGPKHEP